MPYDTESRPPDARPWTPPAPRRSNDLTNSPPSGDSVDSLHAADPAAESPTSDSARATGSEGEFPAADSDPDKESPAGDSLDTAGSDTDSPDEESPAAASHAPAEADHAGAGAADHADSVDHPDLSEHAERGEPGDHVAGEGGASKPSDEDGVRAASQDDGALLPDAVPAAPVAALWPAGATEALRGRWQQIQLRFVDDPHGATGEARTLVGESIDTLTSALAARRDDLAETSPDEDTEHLRMTLRGYRDLLDQLLGH